MMTKDLTTQGTARPYAVNIGVILFIASSRQSIFLSRTYFPRIRGNAIPVVKATGYTTAPFQGDKGLPPYSVRNDDEV